MSIIIFDSKNNKICFSNINIGDCWRSLSDFKTYNQHKILLEIISNTKKICKEIDLLVENIKNSVSNTTNFISVDISNLKSISFIFDDLLTMAKNYAEEKLEIINNLASSEKELILKCKSEIEYYETALKNSTITKDDELEFICDIGNKYHTNFPTYILKIYNKFLDTNFEYKNKSEVQKDEEIYDKYILNIYDKEYKKFVADTIKHYSKYIEDEKQNLKEMSKNYKKNKIKLKTCYFDSFLNFLQMTKNTILYLEYQIKALNCIGYENDDIFNWNNITNEERLLLTKIYANPYNLNIKLPKSEIIYAIEKDKSTIISLTNYVCNSIKSNKGKPYINIMKDFLEKKLVELHQYECKDIIEIINVLFYQYKISNVQINRCLNCGEYFIPKNKSNEKYCNNPSPQNPNKTCKEYGAKKTYRDEIKSIPIKNEHNKTSQFYRMRINRAKEQKEKEKYENDFNLYKENYQKKKTQYKSKRLKEKDFVEWIINQKTLNRKEGNNSENKTI